MPVTAYGRLVKKLRAERCLTLVQLAEKSGLSHVTIGDWERGKRGVKRDNVLAIAAALEVDPSELLKAAGFDAPGGAIIRTPGGNQWRLAKRLTQTDKPIEISDDVAHILAAVDLLEKVEEGTDGDIGEKADETGNGDTGG